MNADSTAGCAYCGLPIPGGPVADGSQYCCFGCRLVDAIVRERDDEAAAQWTLTRLGLSIFFAMNVMAFTMARWSNDLYGAEGNSLSASLHDVFRYLCLLLTLPVMAMLGVPLIRHAWDGLLHRRLVSELLIVAGVLAAFVFSAVSVFSGYGPTYFEVACMVLVLVTLGRWLEATSRQRAVATISKLERLIPEHATKVIARGEEEVAVGGLQVGDDIRIRAGERFPADGCIRSGRTTVDEQIFTGESIPLERSVGDAVLAATMNLDGDVVIRLTAASGAGAFAKLLEILHEARTSRGEYQRNADRIAQRFVPFVAAVAGLVFYFHLPGGALPALMAALSVVLIACPCALGLATPLAMWTALNHAVRHHVLFRSGLALERLAEVKALRFDKTGTLTDGRPHVRCLVLDPDTSPESFFDVVSQLTAASTHVFSRAIHESISSEPEARTASHQVNEIRNIAGSGVEATFADGTLVRLGSANFIKLPENRVPSVIKKAVSQSASGAAHVLVAWNGVVRGVFLIDEKLRPESKSALNNSRALSLDLAVVTGDRPHRAARWGKELNVPVFGGLRPADKVSRVQGTQAVLGPTAMIGDGINDAPALAAADVGISLGCGADVTRDSADVCILSNDLNLVPWSVELARRTRRIVRQNLMWAFAYNTVGIGLAATDRLNPAIAAGLMVASSAIVIINSLRLDAGDSAVELPGGNPAPIPISRPGQAPEKSESPAGRSPMSAVARITGGA